MALIQLQKVSKIYRSDQTELKALDEVDLTIEQGEFVAMMGPSGSGKSTVMNILGCLVRPTSGTYLLDSRDVTSLSTDELASVRNRKIGFVFQGFNLLARTSSLENVELPLYYAHALAAERQQRAEQALREVGLHERLQATPAQLSGGQQQRVAIARAIVNQPQIILADEPTGNLDTRTSISIMHLFQTLWKKGMTVLVVTHEPDIAAFAKRVITVRDGKIVSDKTQTARLAQEMLGS